MAVFAFLTACGLAVSLCSAEAGESAAFCIMDQAGPGLARDTKYIFGAALRPDKQDALTIARLAAAMGALVIIDKDIQDFFQTNRTETINRIGDYLRTIGSAESVFIGNIGLIGAGLWLRRHKRGDKFLQTALLSTKAQLFTEVMTGLVKFTVGRDRPDDGHGKVSFHPFHDFDGSFPSGHAARSFAMAAVFADRYGPPVPLLAYSAAVLISLSGVSQDDHFASDVLAGAALGFAMGKVLSRCHREPDARWAVLPFITNTRRGIGLTIRYTF